MKKTAAFLLALLLTLSCCAALAEDVPPPDQISPDLTSSFVSWVNPIAAGSLGMGDGLMASGDDGLDIVYAYSGINKASSTSIYIAATTEANIKCVVIGGTMYIQRWKDNQWNNYYSHGFTSWGTNSYNSSITVTVEPGYYYRLRTSHLATTYESSQGVLTTTKSVLVN